jgi:hypothetical protein
MCVLLFAVDSRLVGSLEGKGQTRERACQPRCSLVPAPILYPFSFSFPQDSRLILSLAQDELRDTYLSRRPSHPLFFPFGESLQSSSGAEARRPSTSRLSSKLDPLRRSRDAEKAGALPDTHVFSVPKSTWVGSSAAIVHALRQTDGVLRVDVQEPRTRAKRGEPFALPCTMSTLPIDDPKKTCRTFEGHHPNRYRTTHA